MASRSVPCPKICAANPVGSVVAGSNQQQPKPNRISFPHSLGFNGSLSLSKNQPAVWKRHSQLGEVSDSAPVADTKARPESLNGKVEAAESNAPDASALSAFMAQVLDLVKLVDSRDIVELELKQLDCELVIRKKEALQQQAAAAAPVFPMAPPMHHSLPPVQPAAPPTAAATAPSPAPSALAPASAVPAKTSQSSSSSHPPFKCPMAGTFYRSSAPGEPPFVKVGDKVQKGQVVCIVEAMKLMNEIEADQSGTIAEILAEDGKPVSVDAPLFAIVP